MLKTTFVNQTPKTYSKVSNVVKHFFTHEIVFSWPERKQPRIQNARSTGLSMRSAVLGPDSAITAADNTDLWARFS